MSFTLACIDNEKDQLASLERDLNGIPEAERPRLTLYHVDTDMSASYSRIAASLKANPPDALLVDCALSGPPSPPADLEWHISEPVAALPRTEGLQWIEKLRDLLPPNTAIFLWSAYGTSMQTDFQTRLVVAALAAGACDVVWKHNPTDETIAIIKAKVIPSNVPDIFHGMVVGGCPQMQRLVQTIQRFAPGISDFLILGETGVGKDKVAIAIHGESGRAGNEPIEIDCALIDDSIGKRVELFGQEFDQNAISATRRQQNSRQQTRQASGNQSGFPIRGKFELANGGTVFLNEIGELGRAYQAELLTILSSRRISSRVFGNTPITTDFRLVAATSMQINELKAKLSDALFRRIGTGFQIKVPALRERADGHKLMLAEFFLVEAQRRLNKTRFQFSDDARDVLIRHTWPYNVGELENAVNKAVQKASSKIITPDDLELNVSLEDIPRSSARVFPLGSQDQTATFEIANNQPTILEAPTVAVQAIVVCLREFEKPANLQHLSNAFKICRERIRGTWASNHDQATAFTNLLTDRLWEMARKGELETARHATIRNRQAIVQEVVQCYSLWRHGVLAEPIRSWLKAKDFAHQLLDGALAVANADFRSPLSTDNLATCLSRACEAIKMAHPEANWDGQPPPKWNNTCWPALISGLLDRRKHKTLALDAQTDDVAKSIIRAALKKFASGCIWTIDTWLK